jgi:hypothetical protein
LKFPVTVSWYYLKRDHGKLEKGSFCLLDRWRLALLNGGESADGR